MRLRNMQGSILGLVLAAMVAACGGGGSSHTRD